MQKQKATLNEERTAAASYILTFYQNVQTLTQAYANYFNFMADLEQRYETGDLNKVAEEEREALKVHLQNVKYYVRHTYIQYISIHSAAKGKLGKNELSESFTAVTKEFVIDRKQLHEYVLAANKVLTKKIVSDLLQNSADIIDAIYAAHDTATSDQ